MCTFTVLSDGSFSLIFCVCMNKFESKYRLEDHMDIHNKKNQYSCTEFDEKFFIRKTSTGKTYRSKKL